MNLSFPQMPEKLTSTEQDIVEYIAAHRDEFLCMTIGQLSAALHISEATVSRFARHVGCEDFKHLKRTVVEQTVQRGPVQKLSNTLQAKEGDILAAWLEQQRYNLQKTLDLLDREAFAAAVAALLGARKIFLHARNASRAPAVLLEYRLRRIGLEVEQLPSAGSELAERLAAIGPQDVVVLFGFAKVSQAAGVILERQQQAGYRTILFTSRVWHGEGPRADIELFIYRGDEKEQHSMSSPISVVEALSLALSAQMGGAALARLDEIQQLKTAYKDRL